LVDLDAALTELRELRAGSAGRLMLRPTTIDADVDQLFAASCTWESVTPYQVTRHTKPVGAAAALSADLRADCRRRYRLDLGRRCDQSIYGRCQRRGRRGRSRYSRGNCVGDQRQAPSCLCAEHQCELRQGSQQRPAYTPRPTWRRRTAPTANRCRLLFLLPAVRPAPCPSISTM